MYQPIETYPWGEPKKKQEPRRCCRVEIDIPRRNDIFDVQPATVTMYFPYGEPYRFGFWEDEIMFTEEELMNKTREEAQALFHKKDVAYLQS